MKLKDDFFHIENSVKTDTGTDYTIRLNAEHEIYKAHFSGNPITPGVCIIQIIKELTADLLQTELFLKKISNVKFLQVINPLKDAELAVSVAAYGEAGGYKVHASVSNANGIFTKLSLFFTYVQV